MNDYLIIKSKIRPYLKYYLLTHKEVPKHLVNIIDQTPPITLENTLALPLENFKIHGKTLQNGEPTPESPIDIENVEGNITIKVNNRNIFDKEYFLEHKDDFINAYSGYFYAIELGDEYKKQITASISLSDTAMTGVALAFTTSYGTSPGGATRILTINGTMKDVTYDFSNAEHVYLQVGAQTQGIAVDKLEDIFANYNIQVNEGSTALPYEEHKEQLIVFPLSTSQKLMEGDYLADDGIHHVRGQVTLDGTEEGWSNDTQNKLAGARLPGGKRYPSTTTPGNGKSNRYIISNLSNARLNSNMFALYGATDLLAWFNRNGMTLTEYKEWVNSNNITVEYDLAEEIVETFTEAQVTKFEEIKALTGYNNITIVDVTSSDLIPNVSLDYYAKGR